MTDRPKLIAVDFAIAEEVIGAWCETGDKKHTRDLIAEGAARARIASAGKIPTDALTGAWEDIIRAADLVAAQCCRGLAPLDACACNKFSKIMNGR